MYFPGLSDISIYATIKPCPMCGSEAHLHTVDPHVHIFARWMPGYQGGSYVECSGCTCSVSGETKAEAIGTWNRRKQV